MLGWRDTPVDASAIGRVARASQPYIEQIFVRRPSGMDEDALERKLYVVRKRAENEVARIRASKTRTSSTFPSLSCAHDRLQGPAAGAADRQLLPELADPEVISALCLVHQRFSTNTFPSWQLRASLPLHLPQRRDQHAARQRELDARAAVRAARRRCSATTSRSCSRSSRPAAATRRARQRRGVADAGRPQLAARDGHADSRSVGRAIRT